MKNAIEHTPQGSAVTITVRDRIRSLMLEVRDEGCGIKEDELPCLFERFHRGNYGKAGYGIGLSMAGDILKAHHGSIQAANRKEGGACFCLEVPILDGKDLMNPDQDKPEPKFCQNAQDFVIKCLISF